MNRFLRLFRFGNGIMGILGVVIGSFMAVGIDIVNHVPNIIISCLIVISFIAGGNSLNDYVDRKEDEIGHPDRPLHRGEIKPKTAFWCGVGGLVIASTLSLFLGSIEATTSVIVASILMVAYETGLKQRGFVGNITIAVLTGMLFLFGGAVVNNIEGNIVIAIMAIFVSIGREIAKDIEDIESDKESRKTLPMSIGVKKASITAMVFFILGPIFSIYPLLSNMFNMLYCIVFVADAMFIYCAWILLASAHKCQKIAKIAMFVALIAFILGVIQ